MAEAASQGLLEGIPAPARIVRESTFGESRFDLLLEDEHGRRYVEVKSVTLVESGVGLFPDSPTVRGGEAPRHAGPSRGKPATAPPSSSWYSAPMPAPWLRTTRPTRPSPRHSAMRRTPAWEPLAYNCHVSRQEIRLDRRLPIVDYDSIFPAPERRPQP